MPSKTSKRRYYKILHPGLLAPITEFKWFRDRWMPPIKGPLVACSNGYHLTTAKHFRLDMELVVSIHEPWTVWEVEAKKVCVRSDDIGTRKYLCREVRLKKLVARYRPDGEATRWDRFLKIEAKLLAMEK